MGFDRLKRWGKLVMFSHSVFSLPFGVIAMLWAKDGIPELHTIFWILLALLGARNGANAFNRIADRFIDKRNPRTAERPLQTGMVKLGEAWGITIGCFVLMGVAAWQLNPLCFILMPFALAIFIFYSYAKRFTWLCHYVLGAACGGAPVGAWIAVTGKIELPALILGAAVCLWIGGFDVLYATQDIEFDRKEGLHSIPARFGLQRALVMARLSHLGCVLLLGSLIHFMHTGIAYMLGLILITALFCIEHYHVVPGNERKMKVVAYSINQLVSVVFFVTALADFVIQHYS